MKKKVCVLGLLLGLAILFPLSFIAENSKAADSSKFAIAYSGNIMGYFESCG